jgi:peroxiredoxin
MSHNARPSPGEPEPKSKPTTARRQPFFLWILTGLSVITLALGFWKWQQDREMIAQQSRSTPPQIVKSAPEFRLMSPAGAAMNLGDLRGKVVLLNFWATWCSPCNSEMPDLNAIYRRYGNEKDFVVVGVNLQEQPEEVASYAARRSIAFPLLLDRDGHVARRDYQVRTLPASVIIDREGRVRDSWTGPLQREAVLARLEKVW